MADEDYRSAEQRLLDRITEERDKLIRQLSGLQKEVDAFLSKADMTPPWESAGAVWGQMCVRLRKALEESKVAETKVCPHGDCQGEMLELLRQANELYTGYGLICGPIKDFPKYEGNIDQGEWIGKVRDIVRQHEKRKCPYNHADHTITGFLPVQNCPNCA